MRICLSFETRCACLLVSTLTIVSACSSSTTTPQTNQTSGENVISVDNQELESPTTGPADNANPAEQPLINLANFRFVGGFTVPADQYGETSLNYAKGVIEQSDNSLFIVGHEHHDMIAEFTIPEIINSEDISALNNAGDPIQSPVSVLDRSASSNTQAIDDITGLEVIDGKLVINANEYYDAATDNTHTTLLAENAFDLQSSSIDGYYELNGAAHAAGWISSVPPEWQTTVGGDYLSGSSSGRPIISRHSVGPSAFITSASDLLEADAGDLEIPTAKLLDFSLEQPLHEDLFNETRSNDLWTHTSVAVYGFIVPGTRTYATFGHSSGHQSGIGYKITQTDGNLCGGYCPFDSNDQYNYYWFWDMNDLLSVKNGERQAHDVRPYAHGQFEVPYQTSGFNPIGGASYDAVTNTLLVSVLRANNTQGTYSNTPVIAAFEFSQ